MYIHVRISNQNTQNRPSLSLLKFNKLDKDISDYIIELSLNKNILGTVSVTCMLFRSFITNFLF